MIVSGLLEKIPELSELQGLPDPEEMSFLDDGDSMDSDMMIEDAIEAESRYEQHQEEWDKICQRQLHNGTKTYLDGNVPLGKKKTKGEPHSLGPGAGQKRRASSPPRIDMEEETLRSRKTRDRLKIHE
jgi:hypothetical protein